MKIFEFMLVVKNFLLTKKFYNIFEIKVIMKQTYE